MSSADVADLAAHLGRTATESGLSFTVLLTQGEEPVFEASHGLADRAAGLPITSRTRFAVASLSKMFTAVAVLAALDDAGTSPHARVVDLLPERRRPRTLDPAITVHHLLTHTSGMGDYAEEDEDLPGYVEDYGSLWVDRPCYRMRRPDDFLPLYADLPPVAAPGQAFHYCNGGYVLLGALLEQLTGEEFAGAVGARVFEPAGMADSGYFALDEVRPDLALGHLPPRAPGDPWRTNIFSTPVVGGGDGGAFVTSRDVVRFLRALGRGTLLRPETTAQLLTPHVPVEGDLSMGYGVFVGADGRFGHGGGDPGVEALSRHLPSRDTTMVLLANTEGVLDLVYDQVIAAFASLPGSG